MARTWVLYDNEALSAGDALTAPFKPWFYTQHPNDKNIIYFISGNVTNAAPEGRYVYSYNGTSVTELGFNTWLAAQGYSNPYGVVGICYFDSAIYVTFYLQYAGTGYIAKYDISGASWSEAHNFGVVTGGMGTIHADRNRIIVDADDWYETTDGSSWSKAQDSGGDLAGYVALDINRVLETGGDYSLILIEAVSGPNREPFERGAALWTSLRAVDSPEPLNYHDGLAIWGGTLVDNDLYKTDLWGATQTVASDYSGTPVLMKWTTQRFSEDADFAIYETQFLYEWNTTTKIYEATVTVAPAFMFTLGNTVYYAKAGGLGIQFYSGGLFGGEFSDESDVRLLEANKDTEYLYVVGIGSGTLKLWSYNLESNEYIRQVSAGSATYAELDNRTRGIFPIMKPGEDLLYLRGRDGNDLQLQYSDDGGLTLTDLSDAAWGSAKYATCILPDPLNPDDIIIVFSDDDIYRSEDAGDTWAKVIDAPVVQRESARDLLDDKNLLLAGQVAGVGQLHFSPNYGVTTEDVGDASLGIINHIERSL